MTDISTRNVFAAAALQGLLAGNSISGEKRSADEIADLAFGLADAMLARTDERRADDDGQRKAANWARELRAKVPQS